MIVVLGALVLSSTRPLCTAPIGPHSNASIPPLVQEYEAFVRRVHAHGASAVNRRHHDDPVRARRGTETSSHPFARILTTPGNLTAVHHYVVGLAYKLLSLIVPDVDEPIDDVTIQTSEQTIPAAGGDGEVVVGMADMSTRTVTLYVQHIPGINALLTVLMHELFHLMGFGTLSTPPALPFISRTDPLTLRYNSSMVAACVGETSAAAADIKVDAMRTHWSPLTRYFGDDLMLPSLKFGSVKLGQCTVQALLESRPGWTLGLCTTDADCPTGLVCEHISQHWGSVCHTPTPAGAKKSTVDPRIFTAVGLGVGLFFVLLKLCRDTRRATSVPKQTSP